MRILHIEDNHHDAELVRGLVIREWPDADIRRVATAVDFTAALQVGSYDAILSDCTLPGFDGFEALRMAKARSPDVPFIFVSGTIGEDNAIEAVRLGADDYVLKDRIKRLVTAITRAVRDTRDRRSRHNAEARIGELVDCLNQATEALIVTDLDGKVTFWNQGAEQITGWPTMEAMGRSASQLFDATTFYRIASAAEKGRIEGVGNEVQIRDRSGRVRQIAVRITSLRDTAGRQKGRLIQGTDVTARWEAERQVREQAEMLNQAAEAIYIEDLNGRIIYWNAGAENVLGWNRSAVTGRTIAEFIHPDALPLVHAAKTETELSGRWCGELRMRTARGETAVLEVRQTLIRDEFGQPKAHLGIGTDVTETRELEEKFLRSQRMENLGLLAAGIAHDLNNTLAPILLATPMLREHVRDPLARQMVDTLESSAERGSMLVRQILSFTHGVGGEHQLIQVKHLLRDIVAVIAGTFPKSIRLDQTVPTTLWPIEGNPTQVHQVLLNLCVNARDAMPNGGVLQLRGENCVLDEAKAASIPEGRTGSFLVIHVADTGTGIPPEIMDRIWEPFFTTKAAGVGTGLGLSTVRGIVRSHEGFVTVVSKPGLGTCFRVYLPAAETEVLDVVPSSARSFPRGKGELILVVDDEREIREVTSTILSRYGYRVILAADGVEAAAIFSRRASEIHLVISDLHMPNLDGAMLARSMRRTNPGTKLLVVSGMASGLGGRDYNPDDFADGVLLKPFKSEALLEAVQKLLLATSSAVVPAP